MVMSQHQIGLLQTMTIMSRRNLIMIPMIRTIGNVNLSTVKV